MFEPIYSAVADGQTVANAAYIPQFSRTILAGFYNRISVNPSTTAAYRPEQVLGNFEVRSRSTATLRPSLTVQNINASDSYVIAQFLDNSGNVSAAISANGLVKAAVAE